MMQLLYWKKEDEEAVSDFEWKQKIQTNKNNKHGEGLKTKWEQQIFISKLFPSYWHCIVAGLPIFAEGKLSQTGHTHSTRQQQNDCVHTTQEMQIHAGIYVTALNCCMKSVKKHSFDRMEMKRITVPAVRGPLSYCGSIIGQVRT